MNSAVAPGSSPGGDSRLLADYDSDRYGPLFAVSDEGSAGPAVVDAAYSSAKAQALWPIDPLTLGVALDGERMTSAGEVPIGPDEYDALTQAALGRLLCTTNVGVRANARLSQPLPEVPLGQGPASDPAWLDAVVATFAPFVRTPNRRPRPLVVRLSVTPQSALEPLRDAVMAIDAARGLGTIGPPAVHRLSTLVVFDDTIRSERQLMEIERVIDASADAGIEEVAVDGDLLRDARLRAGIQSLLNVLDVPQLRRLLRKAASRGVRLTYRYQLDVESAARTIWTGLHTARSYGFTAGKYGLVPMTFEEQRLAVKLLTRWCEGWTAIPAFYVDTPLVTPDDVFDESRCADAALLWLKMVRGSGATIVLFDSPDRIRPRKLLRSGGASDTGVLTFDDIERIVGYARDLGVSVLWSGGISSRQAFELARRKVFGIFSTSSTATRVAVSVQFEADPRLAAESEPTELGVRRIHAIVQGGFLSASLTNHRPELAANIERLTTRLLEVETDATLQEPALDALNTALCDGWRRLRDDVAGDDGGPKETLHREFPVPADAVRVFRGRRRDAVPEADFIDKLATIFMPVTVQMQRLYGLAAYLPAVPPPTPDRATPDEVALVFYRTQAAYHDAKRCIGGRAYGDLHDLVFDMEESGSGFPVLFAGTVAIDQPYHLFSTSIDWQRGKIHLYLGRRHAGVQVEEFAARSAEIATAVQRSPGPLDGAIFCAGREWIVWWEHSTEAAGLVADFSALASPILVSQARRLRIPGSLTAPFAGLQLDSAGDFINFQFSRA